MERRPPVYNAEDYVLALRKFSKLTGLQLYLDSPLVMETTSNDIPSDNSNKKSADFVNANNRRNKPGSHSSNEKHYYGNGNGSDLEMGLKQFSTITDLLIKLKDDLTFSFPSFIREFIGVPNDGVTHLLDALKAVQLAQTNINGKQGFF